MMPEPKYMCVRCAKLMSGYEELVEHQATCTSQIKVCQKCHQPMKEVVLFTGSVYDCANCARATVNKDDYYYKWTIGAGIPDDGLCPCKLPGCAMNPKKRS
jgi:hypothetical protein